MSPFEYENAKLLTNECDSGMSADLQKLRSAAVFYSRAVDAWYTSELGRAYQSNVEGAIQRRNC